MDSVNMTTETTGIGFIGATSTTNNQGGMTTITANVDPVQNKVMVICHTKNIYEVGNFIYLQYMFINKLFLKIFLF